MQPVETKLEAGPPARVGGTVLGRGRELELVLAALDAGAHVLLEGPPGTGKSTLLRAVAGEQETPFRFVEGNAELTPARLSGHFDPARVLVDGFVPDVFIPGPLLEAMQDGALLYVEEINRVPEETLNLLISVMSEASLYVPRLGVVHAAPGFRLVAAMNPFDAIGTSRISSAVYDRMCRIMMGYQAAEVENDIVDLRVPDLDPAWRAKVVDVVRRTRNHPDLVVGSSVRGAIDLSGIARALARRRGVETTDWTAGCDAAGAALTGRIRLRDSSGRTAEQIVAELWAAVFGAAPKTADDARGDAPGGA